MLFMPNKDLIYQEFGLTLSGERRRKRMSQAQFAGKVGLSRTSVTNIERGRQPIQLYQLYLFASVLQVDVMNLLPKAQNSLETRPASSNHEKKERYIADLTTAIGRRQSRSGSG